MDTGPASQGHSDLLNEWSGPPLRDLCRGPSAKSRGSKRRARRAEERASERGRRASEPRPCRARIILGRKMRSEFIGASNPKEFSLGWNEDVENWRWSQEGHFHLPAASFLPSLIPLLPPLHRRLDISFRDEQRWMKSVASVRPSTLVKNAVMERLAIVTKRERPKKGGEGE